MSTLATDQRMRMKAIVQAEYGSPDVLELKDIDRPEIGDEVLVRVHAAGVDRGVWHLMTGLPYFLRLIIPDLGLRAPKNPVRGSDVAGVVQAVGKDVTRFKPGDEVFASATAPTPSTRLRLRASSQPSP
jgi:NADPH:quinone reductase-like Zn-dependent oxidoreductase